MVAQPEPIPTPPGALSPGGERRRPSEPLPPVFLALLSVVALAPLPFGSVHLWSWPFIATLIGGLLGFWALDRLRTGSPAPVHPRRFTVSLVALGVAVAWAGVQTIGATPNHWHHPAWVTMGHLLGVSGERAISIAPLDTWSTIARWLTVAATFWLALQYGRAVSRVRLGLTVIAVIGAGVAAYGLVMTLGGIEMVLWRERTWSIYRGYVSGTFINRNTFATYAGLVVLIASTFLLEAYFNHRRRAMGRGPSLLKAVETYVAGNWLWLCIWFLAMTALLLSGSRGGFFSTIAGGIVMIFAAGVGAKQTRDLARLAMLLAGLLVLAAFAMSGETLVASFGPQFGESAAGRGVIYDLTVRALADRPLLGSGAGTFQNLFYLYWDPALGMRATETHNSYLDSIVTLGLPAGVLPTLAVAAAAFPCISGLRRRRRDTIFPALGVGATALVGVHALMDFSLENLAVATTYFFMLGLCVAQSWSSAEDTAKISGGVQRRRRLV